MIITQTTSSTAPAPEEVYQLVLKVPPKRPTPPGHALGSVQRRAFPQPVSLSREQNIGNRIQALLTQGAEIKISTFINQLTQSPCLSLEARREVEHWAIGFETIDPNDREARSLALAVLFFQVLRPSLREGKSLEERKQLEALEDECKKILQQTLPIGRCVDEFLEICDLGLREERLLRDLCGRADAAAAAQVGALCTLSQRMQMELEQSYGVCKERLSKLHNQRKVVHQQIDAQMEAIQVKMEQLGQAIARQAMNIAELNTPSASLESDLALTKRSISKLL